MSNAFGDRMEMKVALEKLERRQGKVRVRGPLIYRLSQPDLKRRQPWRRLMWVWAGSLHIV